MKISIILFVIFYLQFSNTASYNETWNGRWFPFGPGQLDQNPVIAHFDEQAPVMSTSDPYCDDGKTNLTIDWDGNAWTYSCFLPRSLYRSDPSIRPVLRCEHIPSSYSAIHHCMNTSILYDRDIPTYGTHRPVWARYGQYRYLPPQRWLHNLEHGALVMLYHPCANQNEVSRLASLVKGCLYRHVISTHPMLSQTRPLALVTWGCTYEMSYVHEDSVREFVRRHALHGAERTPRDGLYEQELVEPARFVSDPQDSQLCPSTRP